MSYVLVLILNTAYTGFMYTPPTAIYPSRDACYQAGKDAAMSLSERSDVRYTCVPVPAPPINSH